MTQGEKKEFFVASVVWLVLLPVFVVGAWYVIIKVCLAHIAETAIVVLILLVGLMLTKSSPRIGGRI